MVQIDESSTITASITSGLSDEYNPSQLSYRKFVETSSGSNNLIVPFESFFDKYYDAIKSEFVEEMELTEDDLSKYKYNPKRLSYDSFGTVELWTAILRINDMASVMEFNSSKILMFTSDFKEIVDEMINLEQDEKSENDNEIENNI